MFLYLQLFNYICASLLSGVIEVCEVGFQQVSTGMKKEGKKDCLLLPTCIKVIMILIFSLSHLKDFKVFLDSKAGRRR